MTALDWAIAAVLTSPAWATALHEGCAELRMWLAPSDRWADREPAALPAPSIPPARGMVIDADEVR